MQADPNERTGNSEQFCADRIGFAKLTTMAFHGTDLRPMRDDLMAKVADGTATSGDGLDLSLIAQLLGDKQTGLSIQAEVVAFHQLFRSPCVAPTPKLRVLALAAPIDMGGRPPTPPARGAARHKAVTGRTAAAGSSCPPRPRLHRPGLALPGAAGRRRRRAACALADGDRWRG